MAAKNCSHPNTGYTCRKKPNSLKKSSARNSGSSGRSVTPQINIFAVTWHTITIYFSVTYLLFNFQHSSQVIISQFGNSYRKLIYHYIIFLRLASFLNHVFNLPSFCFIYSITSGCNGYLNFHEESDSE
jgi:hypothetical protein